MKTEQEVKELVKQAYNLGVEDAVNYCGYNTTVMNVIAPSKRKEFMEKYKRPKFKSNRKIYKELGLSYS